MKRFNNYDFRLFRSFTDMYEHMREKERTVGLCRLCGGYAWKWNKDTPDIPDIQIQNTSIWWNRQTSGWLRNPDAKEEMGSIYTLPGLDLNYAVVVMGPELYCKTHDKTNRIICIKNYILHPVKRRTQKAKTRQK